MAHAKLPIFFLLFLILSYGAATGALEENNVQPASTTISLTGVRIMNQRQYLLHKGGMPMKSRKLLEGEDLVHVDYDDAGPNPKHDPRRGRGGRNR